MFNKCNLLALIALFSFLIIAPVHAGVLNGNANAVAFSGFSGSSTFSSGSLVGDLDYSVFTASEFSSAFPSSGYAPLGGVVYAYQITNTGAAAISTEIIGVSNPVSGDISSFLNAAGEVAPSTALFSSGNATWLFSAPNLLNTEVSEIMVFSSPNTPISGVSLTINGGTSSLLVGIPTPGPTAIPEPAGVCLAMVGAFALLATRRKK